MSQGSGHDGCVGRCFFDLFECIKPIAVEIALTSQHGIRREKREKETNFVEPPFPFLTHSALFEHATLPVDPIAQYRVKAVPCSHIACNSGRETGGGVSGGIQDEGKTVGNRKQLTVTICSPVFTQILVLQIPRPFHATGHFMKPPFTFRIHFGIFQWVVGFSTTRGFSLGFGANCE
jgi:hypothetical protein